MNKEKREKKRKPKPTADAHSFVSRWNPRAPFGLVVLDVNPRSPTTYTHTPSVHHTSYLLHAARKDTSRHRNQLCAAFRYIHVPPPGGSAFEQN